MRIFLLFSLDSEFSVKQLSCNTFNSFFKSYTWSKRYDFIADILPLSLSSGDWNRSSKLLGKTACGLGVRVLLFKEGVASFSSSTCHDYMLKQLISEFSNVMSTSSSGKFNTYSTGLVILNGWSIIPLFLNSAISFSNAWFVIVVGRPIVL